VATSAIRQASCSSRGKPSAELRTLHITAMRENPTQMPISIEEACSVAKIAETEFDRNDDAANRDIRSNSTPVAVASGRTHPRLCPRYGRVTPYRGVPAWCEGADYAETVDATPARSGPVL
jgi:hypothetical protein